MHQDEEQYFEEPEESRKPGLLTVLLSLLVLIAMLATLVWPLLQARYRPIPTPTPTPLFLQEA